MAKYIKCDFCRKKIYFGAIAYHRSFCTVYCSIDCYFDANGGETTVDEDFVEECDRTVYDDEARREEIRKEMEEHRMAMEKLFEELQTLITQN